MTYQKFRLTPALKAGSLWFIEIETGNRKKNSRKSVKVSDAVYTLAQASAFCANNRASDFKELEEIA